VTHPYSTKHDRDKKLKRISMKFTIVYFNEIHEERKIRLKVTAFSIRAGCRNSRLLQRPSADTHLDGPAVDSWLQPRYFPSATVHGLGTTNPTTKGFESRPGQGHLCTPSNATHRRNSGTALPRPGLDADYDLGTFGRVYTHTSRKERK
jgi:hypothetical protein